MTEPKRWYIAAHRGELIGADRLPTAKEMFDGLSFGGDEDYPEWQEVSREKYDETVLDLRFENGEWLQ